MTETRPSSKRIVVIGGGPGGYVAAIRASQLGAKVLLVESDRIGGTCLNRGCIPTKALLHDAGLLRTLRQSPVFGSCIPERADLLQAMMERKSKVVEEMVKGIEILLESHRVTVYYGKADLPGGKRVGVLTNTGEREIFEADSIILAPGSKSKTLPGMVPDGTKIITSDDALEMRNLPKQIVIVGGGYIGAEFATLFSALGSKVTIVEILEEILPGLDSEIVRNLKRVLERDEVRVLTGSSLDEIRHKEDRLILKVRTPGGIEDISAEKLLVATGRGPRLDLGFEKAGVERSSSGVRVNSRMETSAPDVYAVGDAAGGALLAYVASEEGIVAAENAMGIDRRKEENPIPLCIFTHPEIASIGLTEKEARAKEEIRLGRFPFRSNSRAQVSGETDGLIKVISSRQNDQVLGIHIIGPGASELLSLATMIVGRKIRAGEFTDLLQAHPTLSEALKEAVLDTGGLAIHLPRPLRKK
jgi:dihydrolipoamide dehydrogenase